MAAFAGSLLLGFLPLGDGAPAPSRLAVIRTAPDFALEDTDGRRVTLHQYRGKVVLVGFIFTTCSGSCPATTHRMAKVQETLARLRDCKDRVQLVSITLDPERDTHARLRDYMRLYEINPANWCFLTGAKEAVRHTIADWGMWAKPAANGQLDHPSRVFLVDPRGRVREVYNLEFLRTAWVMDDVRLLLEETQKK
jgi:protein SCO1/2